MGGLRGGPLSRRRARFTLDAPPDHGPDRSGARSGAGGCLADALLTPHGAKSRPDAASAPNVNQPNQNRWVGLPQLGLNLARCERDIATHRLTLSTNAFNAAQAAEALLREGDTFLKAFLKQDAPTWLRQMDHDLEVLHAGQRYPEQLISALRAIVALDGQKLQRKLEGEEKARNRSLQLTIFFVGAALSFSGLAAATRPRPTAAVAAGQAGFHAAGLWLGDIAIHFVIGVLAALSLFGLWRLSGLRRLPSRSSSRRRLEMGQPALQVRRSDGTDPSGGPTPGAGPLPRRLKADDR